MENGWSTLKPVRQQKPYASGNLVSLSVPSLTIRSFLSEAFEIALLFGLLLVFVNIFWFYWLAFLWIRDLCKSVDLDSIVVHAFR
jgi:hypothetical protein